MSAISRRRTLVITASSNARSSFDFFHTRLGAIATTQSDSPLPTTVTFRCRQSLWPSIGSS